MTTTPILGATDLVASQAIPETTVNESMRRIEQGAQFFNVLDKDLTAPPGSPVDGAAYIVGPSATGAWAGKDESLAYYQTGSGWMFVTALEGFHAWVQDEGLLYRYDGAAWVLFTGVSYTDAQARAAVNIAPTTVSGTSHAAALGDEGGYFRCTNAAAVAFAVPPNSSEPFAVGTVLTIEQADAGTVTITPGSGVTLNSRGGLLATAGQYAVAQVKKVATDTWTVIGDVA